MRNQSRNKLNKFKDNSRGGRRWGQGSGGGNAGGGGGGGGARHGAGNEQRFRGFRNGHENFRNNQSQYSEDRGFNEFQGINEYNFAYETKNNHEELTQPAPPTVVCTPPPSFLKELSVSKEIQAKIIPENASVRSESSCLEKAEPTTPVRSIKKEKMEQMLDIKSIKQEKVDTPIAKPMKVNVKEKPPPADSSSSSSSSEENSSSEESSSSEEEAPTMPKPMKSAVKPKKEPKNEDEVICLGKQENYENLIDDNEMDCLVCKTQGHNAEQCQMKCVKCSHSSYKTHVICNSCGETYPPKEKAPNAPNPFLLFMQFMQFCMSQYTDYSSEINQPFPGPVPLQGSTKEIEITRQDIADTKRRRKKSKSDSKLIRKKKKSEKSSDSDSDSSSKKTASVKKRKKCDTAQPTIPVLQPKQQSLPHFSGVFPNNAPFASGFSNPGYNPMLAFTQMMGYNPTAMNFPR